MFLQLVSYQPQENPAYSRDHPDGKEQNICFFLQEENQDSMLRLQGRHWWKPQLLQVGYS